LAQGAAALPPALSFSGESKLANDPVSAVAGWLTPATPEVPAAGDTDPVLAMIAELNRLDALWAAAQARGAEILNTLPEDIRKGRVRVSFGDSELGRCLSSPGYFTSEQQLQRFLDPWRRFDMRMAKHKAKSPEAAAAEFDREIGLDQLLAQLRAGLDEIKAIREASGCEAHYREADDLEPRMRELGHQIDTTKPVTIAGAIAMLERLRDAYCVAHNEINPVIAGLRDIQSEKGGAT
jgi:hypothetical protein